MSKLTNIVKNIKLPKSLSVAKLKLEKHSPEIMVATGAVLVVGAAVYACKQTIKAKDILDEATDEIDAINLGQEIATEANIPESEARSQRMKVYSKTALEMVKLYGLPVLAGVTGLGLMLGAHKVLKDRNAALTLAYSNLLANYQSYRDRVKAAVGEDKERMINMDAEKKSIVVVDDEGNKENVKGATVIKDPTNGYSAYARIFDESNDNWSKDPSSNIFFLRTQMSFLNDKLRARGYLFLNEAYEALGFKPTTPGQIVGWVYDPRNEIRPEGMDGDDMIDFGIYDIMYYDKPKRDFINAAEPCIWLDFNVDGVVYDLIDQF